MTTRKEMRRQQRADDKIVMRAQGKARGNKCVWNSLLAGSVGLENRTLRSYADLLSFIRDRIKRWGPSCSQSNVQWQGVPLCNHEMQECKEAVLHNIQIGDGYCCGACDPLLAAYAFAFRVNVEHAYLDNEFKFEVDAPRRCVRLQSSLGHMAHVENCEIRRNHADDENRDGRMSRGNIHDGCQIQGSNDKFEQGSSDVLEQKDVSASTRSKRSGQCARPHVENRAMRRNGPGVQTCDGRVSRRNIRDECHEQGSDDDIDQGSSDVLEQEDVSARTMSKRSGHRARRNKAYSKCGDCTLGIKAEGATKLERRAARRALKLTLSMSQVEED
mmetsp:Transcript_12988/g.24523  ORF Transcript_12988/g.24523 Transcript_12988/m.24523 type:complete len:330 (-) Transcript_12988:21-1010(-)